VAGRVDNWSGHERIRMMNPLGSGSSACRSVDPPADLVDLSAGFVERLGWNGLFMLEFLTDADRVPWFMEMNGRAWGSLALAIRRGLSYPTWAVRAALEAGNAPQPVVPGPHVTVRHLGRELRHLALVARGQYRARRAGAGAGATVSGGQDLSLLQAARHVLTWERSQHLYNARRGRGAVLLADTVGTLLNRTGP
jgi:hypothetical protein